jgi:hypothetical protein
MPQISANDLARLRQTRQWSQIYMVVHVPNTLMTGIINDGTIERGEMDIVFDNGGAGVGYTQALFDAFDENTTLWVGSYAGGRDIGIIRVRSITRDAWPPISGTVHVAENDGILWVDDLYLTVLDEHRIWPKFLRVDVNEDTDPATITWWKDYDIVHSWQTHQEPPVVVMGPPACAFIDPSTGLATVNFWGSDSYSPRGTALSGTISWIFAQGTPATANTLGTEAVPHVVTWSALGVYTVKLSITDANGRTSSGYRNVFILSRT